MKLTFKIVVSIAILSAVALFCYFQYQDNTFSHNEAVGLFLQSKQNTPDIDFDKFIPKFKRNYKDKTEYNRRKATFAANWLEIQKINQNAKGFKVDVNQFADMTKEEIA